MIRPIPTLILGLTAVGLYASAEVVPTHYRYWRSARSTRATDAKGFAAIPLDPLMFRVMRNPGSELRITAIDGREIPFRVLRSTKTGETVEWRDEPCDWREIPTAPDKPDWYAVKFRNPVMAGGIALGMNRGDFVRLLTVEGAPDGKNFSVLAAGVPVYHDGSRTGLEKLQVEFPPVPVKELRLTLEQPAGPDALPVLPLLLGGVVEPELSKKIEQLLREPVKIETLIPRRRVMVSAARPRLTEVPVLNCEKAEKGGWILETGRVPVSAVRITAADGSYVRNVRIFAYRTGDERELGTGRIWGFGSGAKRETGEWLEIPESRERAYRIELEDGGAPPLRNVRIQLTGPSFRILAPGPVPAHVVLYLGGPDRYPDYDADKKLLGQTGDDALNPYWLRRHLEFNRVYHRDDPTLRRRTGWGALLTAAAVFSAVLLAYPVLQRKRRRKHGA